MKNQHWPVITLAVVCALQACSDPDDDNGSGTPQAGSGGSRTTTAGASSTSGRGGVGGGGGGGIDAAGAAGEDDGVGGNAGESGSPNGGMAGALGEGGGGGSDAREDTCLFPESAALDSAAVAEGYCAYTWATNLNRPRGVVVDEAGDVLVSDNGRIVLLHDDDGSGVSEAEERVVLRTQAGLNHGIALDQGYLYASTATTVYRWPYAGDREPLGEPQEVVTGIPSGGHVTRTLQFDTVGRLYVSIGSAGNVDEDSLRSRILRYPAAALGQSSTFEEGEVFADGLRNEVGLALDGQGRLWGVENGRDNLQRPDLGTNISEDNPGEELNLFLEENAGRFYGYPYCWSEYDLPNGDGPGTQWADPTNTTHDDAWCKDPDNVIPPVLVMQGHSAPLDIEFYTGGSFPATVLGDAFVTFHGSWNRTTATGYKVVRIPFGQDGLPAGDPAPILESANPGDTDPEWPHRPVGLGIGQRGQLFVTSDVSGVIIAVGHEGS